jgi:hypothetical protein
MSERKLTDREIETILSDYTIMREALIEIMATTDTSSPGQVSTAHKMRRKAEEALAEIEG